jgi:hypothetical protein
MTSQTYSTRRLTARDHRLLDMLERDPRYRSRAHAIRPPTPEPKAAPKPEPKASLPVREVSHDPEPPPIPKPVPKGR